MAIELVHQFLELFLGLDLVQLLIHYDEPEHVVAEKIVADLLHKPALTHMVLTSNVKERYGVLSLSQYLVGPMQLLLLAKISVVLSDHSN